MAAKRRLTAMVAGDESTAAMAAARDARGRVRTDVTETPQRLALERARKLPTGTNRLSDEQIERLWGSIDAETRKRYLAAGEPAPQS